MSGELVTAQEALAAWDRGDIVTTVEMGGIGPSYEQTIQILVFEIIRDGGAHEAAVTRANPTCQFSGAQVGVARRLAGRFLEHGWAATLAEVDPDRQIQVSRWWPKPPEVAAA